MVPGCFRPVILLLLVVPARAAAQVGISLGAGPTLPVGSYGQAAKTGWMAHGRIFLTLQERLELLGGVFYGLNDHDVVVPEEREESELLGLVGGMSYRIGDPARPGVFVFWELGWMRHYRYYYPEKWISYSGGLGLAVPLSSPFELWLSGSYLGGAFDTDVALWGLTAGIRLRLTGANP